MDLSKQKAEDWLDDLETVGGYAAEKIGDVTKNMPIVKALGAIATNPTPQEIGAQVYNLGSAISESAREATKDPIGAAINYGPMGAMVAYHGTPHKIVGGFKKEAIGSGEGAQAFGHGFYATEAKGIAKSYAKDLSKNIFEIGGERFEGPALSNNAEIFQVWDKYGKDYAKKMAENEKNALLGEGPFTIKEAIDKGATQIAEIRKRRVSEIDRLLSAMDKGELKKIPQGRIYTLDIPEKDVMLDWDKPIMEQPEAVKAAIKNMQGGAKGGWLNLYSGQSLYQNMINTFGSPSKASDALLKAGIKGINYPAGSISGAKTTARNYVIFEPEDIKITAEEFLDK